MGKLTEHQKWLIQTSFEHLTLNIDTVIGNFYGHIFETAPELKPLFKEDLPVQGRKFIRMLLMVVNHLDNLASVETDIQALGGRHHSYGAQAQYFPMVEDALLCAIEQEMGEQFTLEMDAAWRTVYRMMAENMQLQA